MPHKLIVVSNLRLSDLLNKINEKIGEGYVPCGGVTMLPLVGPSQTLYNKKAKPDKKGAAKPEAVEGGVIGEPVVPAEPTKKKTTKKKKKANKSSKSKAKTADGGT